MPFLDVSDILLDPDLADTFKVLRRRQVFGPGGVAKFITEKLPAVVGVVCHATPNALRRDDDKATMGRAISIVTQFRLRGTARDAAAQNWQPDVVVWQGSGYVVRVVDPYTRFGGGFVEAAAESMDTQDFPFTNLPAAVGRLAFNYPRNAAYAPMVARTC